MNKSSKGVGTHSIHDYLNLDLHSWLVEFDVSDFGASLSTLFELPLSVYLSQARDFFWIFLSNFTLDCSIAFILRSCDDSISLALLGSWKNQKLAIPLWIMNDTLTGFETIHSGDYSTLDSFPLNFNSLFRQNSPESRKKGFYVLDNEFYQGNMFYLKIINDSLILSDYQQIDELVFFERIAAAVIPEIDEKFSNDKIDNN